jgi:hypothetical protein
MSKEDLVTRREFTVETAQAMLAGVAITITGCDDEPSSGPSGGGGGINGTVSTDDGHSHGGATITDAQITAGNAITLTLTGSGHTHTVDLTSSEVVSIGAGTRVQKTSSSDQAHTHTVTFN